PAPPKGDDAMSQATAVMPTPTMIPADIALAMTQQLFTLPARWSSEEASRMGPVRFAIRKIQDAASMPLGPVTPGTTPEKAIRFAAHRTVSAAVVEIIGSGLRSWRRWQSRQASTKATARVRTQSTTDGRRHDLPDGGEGRF